MRRSRIAPRREAPFETGTADDRAAADELAAAWIAEYHPGAIAHAFTESPKGITYRNQWNETTRLIFDAERGQVTAEPVCDPSGHL